MTVEYMITGGAADQLHDTPAALDIFTPHRVVTSFNALGAMIAAESRGVDYERPTAKYLSNDGQRSTAAGLGARTCIWRLGSHA